MSSFSRKFARKDKPHEAKRDKRFWNNLYEYQSHLKDKPDWFGARKSLERSKGVGSPCLPNF